MLLTDDTNSNSANDIYSDSTKTVFMTKTVPLTFTVAMVMAITMTVTATLTTTKMRL